MSSERGALQIPIAGVTLLAIMLLIAVHGLLMGQAAETLDSLIRHDLEEELIFRGEEIKNGIEAWRKDNVGRMPTKYELLCPKEKNNKRYIRKLWKDPMTGKDFRFISPADVGKRHRENEERRRQEAEDGEDTNDGFSIRNRKNRPSKPETNPDNMPGRESKIEFSGDQPFLGVASNRSDKAFREYMGMHYYDEWEFTASDRLDPRGQRENQRTSPTPTPVTTPTPR